MQTKKVATLLGLILVLSLGSLSVSAATKTTTIRVEGMKCNQCSASVAKALKATDGVEKVEVSSEKGEAVIQYDDQKVTEAKLREVINSTGFKAVEEKSASSAKMGSD
jgi:mercuric transport protein